MSDILDLLKDKDEFNESLVSNAQLKLIDNKKLIIKCNKKFYNQDSLLMFFLFIFPLICIFIIALFINLLVLIFGSIFFILLLFIILLSDHWTELPPDWIIDKENAIATYEKSFLWHTMRGKINFSEIQYLIIYPSDQYSKDSLTILVNTPNTLEEILVTSGDKTGCKKLGINIAELTKKTLYHKEGGYREKIFL